MTASSRLAVKAVLCCSVNIWKQEKMLLCLNGCSVLPPAFGVTVLWLGFVVQRRAPYPNFLPLCLVYVTRVYFNWLNTRTRRRFCTLFQRSCGSFHHMWAFILTLSCSGCSCIYAFWYQYIRKENTEVNSFQMQRTTQTDVAHWAHFVVETCKILSPCFVNLKCLYFSCWNAQPSACGETFRNIAFYWKRNFL